MVLSDPSADSLEITSLQKVKKLLDFIPMGLGTPGTDCLEIVALHPVLKNRYY